MSTIKVPSFLEFLMSLTASISADIASGTSMLCVSRLTPFIEPEWDIRPIAVGGIFYRLAAKALQDAYKSDCLETFQLGAWGVREVLSRSCACRRKGSATAHSTNRMHAWHLDSTSALNTMAPQDIADAPPQIREGPLLRWPLGVPCRIVSEG